MPTKAQLVEMINCQNKKINELEEELYKEQQKCKKYLVKIRKDGDCIITARNEMEKSWNKLFDDID